MPPNFALLPELNRRIRDKRCRYGAYRDRALEEIKTIKKEMAIPNPIDPIQQ